MQAGDRKPANAHLVDKQTMASNRGHLTLLGICTAILVFIAFYYARAVLAPVVFALFAIALVWPLQAYLQARIPKLVAAGITVVLVIIVVTILATLIGWGFGRAARWLLADLARFQAMYQQATAWLEEHGFVITGLFGEVFNGSWVIAMLQRVGSRLQGMLSFAIVTLIYMLLGLLEVDTIADKLRALRNPAIGTSLVAAAGQAAAKLQKYMLVRTVMSVMTGALVYGFATLIGLPLAAEWGVIAFALNYIPFHRPLHRYDRTDALCLCTVRIMGNGTHRVCMPESDSVCGRELSGTARCRQRAVAFAVCGAVRDLSVELSLGHIRRLHRCANRDRDPDGLRAISGEPLGIRGARGRRTQDRLIRTCHFGLCAYCVQAWCAAATGKLLMSCGWLPGISIRSGCSSSRSG